MFGISTIHPKAKYCSGHDDSCIFSMLSRTCSGRVSYADIVSGRMESSIHPNSTATQHRRQRSARVDFCTGMDGHRFVCHCLVRSSGDYKGGVRQGRIGERGEAWRFDAAFPILPHYDQPQSLLLYLTEKIKDIIWRYYDLGEKYITAHRAVMSVNDCKPRR